MMCQNVTARQKCGNVARYRVTSYGAEVYVCGLCLYIWRTRPNVKVEKLP